MSRQPPWDATVTYGAVGGTKAPDLLAFPPTGFRPFEQRSRIGHGVARWEHAWQSTMTWGIQRGSGMRVQLNESPAEVTEGTYTPVAFDGAGRPVAPELTAGSGEESEVVYGAEGQSFIAPGDTALLVVPFWFFGVHAPCRVIYVIDEPNRKGFAYGTLPGHPESGEEAFIVDQTEDGSVWLTIRAFSRPAGWLWWMVYPVLRLTQTMITRRYFRSLSDPLG
ncbi:DUF1990 domain-containing protein [Leifsonia bigeumensis]|uniref:DUF1990 domain-containing protein n=1 Tax=Leifsonella bigeumensis TaxID=433643 RepID=A0ABP7FM92_9MICO